MVAQNQPVSSLNKEGTIRTAMHLFPRQFGLQNVFSPPTGQVPLALRNFVAREKEIVAKFGGNKTQDKELKVPVPKRLRGTPLDLVEKMRTLHRKCVYPALFKYYCPERHKDSAPGTILVQLATPLPQVSAFCQAVFHNVIPDEFWGSGDIQTHNKAEFFKKVDSFVRLQRHEKLNLHTVLQGLKVRLVNICVYFSLPSLLTDYPSDCRDSMAGTSQAQVFKFEQNRPGETARNIC